MKDIKLLKQLKKLENGQSLMEMALTMSILLILLVGIVDIGRALFTYLALRDAAQEGALYGSTSPTSTSDIETRVWNSSTLLQNLADDPNADTNIAVTLIGSPCTGNGIQVRVSYENFPITMPFLGTLIGRQTVPISSTIVDTILAPACP
jgi:Flp pilus assembly protein TadG